MITVQIKLNLVGTDCSTFDLYSNADGFLSAFESDVPKQSLIDCYSSANVPDYTTVIRVMAKGLCSNYTDLPLQQSTTTTTTTNNDTTSPPAYDDPYIISQNPTSDIGTFEIRVLFGIPNQQYRLRANASFTGEGNTITFTNLELPIMDSTHTIRTGSLFSVDQDGERVGTYTVDGTGISCFIELLDINNNVISSTGFSTSPA